MGVKVSICSLHRCGPGQALSCVLPRLHAAGFFSLFTLCRSLGTVGAVALDSKGDVACATSTGGIVNKMVGRVGDTPCIGRAGGGLPPPLPSLIKFMFADCSPPPPLGAGRSEGSLGTGALLPTQQALCFPSSA